MRGENTGIDSGFIFGETFSVLMEPLSPCSGWFNVLSKVRVCTPEQLLEMSHEQANPKNAVVSLISLM